MSISSYRENVKKRVAGPNLPVCFPASLEQITPKHGFKPRIYTYYHDFVDYLDSLSLDELESRKVLEEQEEMVNVLLRPLGGLAIEDIALKNIRTELGLKRAINQYTDDHSIIVDVKYGKNSNRSVHSVGVLPIQEDSLMLFSNHIPSKLRGIISVSKLAINLAMNNEAVVDGHPYATANFIAIPKN